MKKLFVVLLVLTMAIFIFAEEQTLTIRERLEAIEEQVAKIEGLEANKADKALAGNLQLTGSYTLVWDLMNTNMFQIGGSSFYAKISVLENTGISLSGSLWNFPGVKLWHKWVLSDEVDVTFGYLNNGGTNTVYFYPMTLLNIGPRNILGSNAQSNSIAAKLNAANNDLLFFIEPVLFTDSAVYNAHTALGFGYKGLQARGTFRDLNGVPTARADLGLNLGRFFDTSVNFLGWVGADFGAINVPTLPSPNWGFALGVRFNGLAADIEANIPNVGDISFGAGVRYSWDRYSLELIGKQTGRLGPTSLEPKASARYGRITYSFVPEVSITGSDLQLEKLHITVNGAF